MIDQSPLLNGVFLIPQHLYEEQRSLHRLSQIMGSSRPEMSG
jgi:hypothetical protein